MESSNCFNLAPEIGPEADPRAQSIHEVEKAEHAFSAAGFHLKVTRLEDRSPFSMNFGVRSFGRADLIHTIWGLDSWQRVQLDGRMAVILNRGGALPSLFKVSGSAIPATSATAPIIPPETEFEIFRTASSPLFVLSANMLDLKQHFFEVFGTEHERLEFEHCMDRRSSEGRGFERLISFIVQELGANPSALKNPIFRRQFDELVLGGLLMLPGRHHRLTDASSEALGSALVCRAEEFMEANVEHPIVMSEVAAQCGCSRTKLFQTFKEKRGITPLQFLVRRRMERARKRLLAPCETESVTRVSLDCGYASISRFAKEYRKLYGEAPSTTLSRSR